MKLRDDTSRAAWAPNSLMNTTFRKRPKLLGLYFLAWFVALIYVVTVRVLAAPGSGSSRALGYIDRAQKVEAYCIATVALLITIVAGPVAFLTVPMSAAAVALCVVEAIRLSRISYRRNEYIMLAVLAPVIAVGGGLAAREGWVWFKWRQGTPKTASQIPPNGNPKV